MPVGPGPLEAAAPPRPLPPAHRADRAGRRHPPLRGAASSPCSRSRWPSRRCSAILGLGSGVAATVHGILGGSRLEHLARRRGPAVRRPRGGRSCARSPGVAAAEPVLTGEVELRGEDAFTWGVAADDDVPLPAGRRRAGTGRGEERAAARVAVVERNLARATGIRVGDVARRRGPPAGRCRCASSASPPTSRRRARSLFVPLSTARALSRRSGRRRTATGSGRRSADHAAIDGVATRVEDALVAHGYPTTHRDHLRRGARRSGERTGRSRPRSPCSASW